MAYETDIGKFVFIEYVREDGPAKAKGILKEVRVLSDGRLLLRIEHVTNSDIAYMISEEAITSFFSRPFREEAENGKERN